MTDAKFDLSGIEFVAKTTREIEITVSNCTHDFDKVCSTLNSEYSSFQSDKSRAESEVQSKISYIRQMINEIEREKQSAQQKKQKEKSYPEKPSIPDKATDQQKQAIIASYREQARKVDMENERIQKENQAIDAYCARCEDAIARLNEIIGKMTPYIERIKKEGSHVSSVVEDFRMKIYGTKNSNQRVASAMGTFNSVLSRAHEAAQRIVLMTPHSVSGYYDINRQFTIKNKHNHVASPSIFSSSGASTGGNINLGSYASSSTMVDNSDVINEKDVDAFFELINGRSTVSMPSGNVRKLGGKKFTDKMKELGYETVIQDNGAIIDKNGIVHWEKKNG